MGRTVSSPSRTIAKIYTHIEFGEDVDDSGMEWIDFVENLGSELDVLCKRRLVRHGHSNGWIGNEDKVCWSDEGRIFAIGLSEWCGLVSVWAIDASCEYDALRLQEAVSLRSRSMIARMQFILERALQAMGQPVLGKRGTFSNGEAVYERK